MIRTAADSDQIGALIPLDGRVDFIMTYADLVRDTADLNELRAEFKHSELVFVDRNLGDPLDLATIIDVEPGAYSADQIPGWIHRKKAAGKEYLTGYCDRSHLAAVQAIARHQIWHFIATLDGTMHLSGWQPMRGPALIQILGEQQLGVHADFTVILEDKWRPAR